MTIIGEHGYELLFGQKLKISLARSIYRQADIYLLDDPFGTLRQCLSLFVYQISSLLLSLLCAGCVDSYVGRTIFNKCICGLLKDSTVVLVTQQLPYVKVADQVLVMQEVRSRFLLPQRL